MAPNDYACFRTRDVAAAAGLTQTQLEKLLDRHILVAGPQDIDPGGSGRPRLFTRGTAYRIAVAAALLNAGLPPARAAALAERAVRLSGRLVILGTEISVQTGNDSSLPPASVVVNLDALAAAVDQRLPEVA